VVNDDNLVREFVQLQFEMQVTYGGCDAPGFIPCCDHAENSFRGQGSNCAFMNCCNVRATPDAFRRDTRPFAIFEEIDRANEIVLDELAAGGLIAGFRWCISAVESPLTHGSPFD
jgi:hypothetical protein